MDYTYRKRRRHSVCVNDPAALLSRNGACSATIACAMDEYLPLGGLFARNKAREKLHQESAYNETDAVDCNCSTPGFCHAVRRVNGLEMRD
nr:hypothetical protein CFP56_04034 [Quercus suber]